MQDATDELKEQTEELIALSNSMGNPPPQPPPTRILDESGRRIPPLPTPPAANIRYERDGETGMIRPRRIPTPEEIEKYYNLRQAGKLGAPIAKKVKPKDLYGEMMKDE